MQWKKLGLLYVLPDEGIHEKLMSHAANPLAVNMGGDNYRIFYSARDAQNRSSVGAVDVDIVKRKIIKEHRNPYFTNGPPGSYFSHGVSIGNCYEVEGTRYMLFMGWQYHEGEHWRGDVGRLLVTPDLTLELATEVSEPFIGANKTDPISLSYPWVEVDPRGGYNMWYGSTKTWDAGNGEMLHTLNYANSVDGHQWGLKGPAIPYKLNVAQAFSRPTVLTDSEGGYHMWFSYRSGLGDSYRIGYAHCGEDLEWTLDLSNAGITVSSSGWDSEMIEYPYVFTHNDDNYMLYNGNSYGKSGFGLAVLDDA